MSKRLSPAPVSVCTFTFADGRHCRMPRSETHPYLCHFHGRRESLSRAQEVVGLQVTNCFSGGYVTACDLSAAMAQVFAATARGEIKPRTAGILGYLGQTIVQTIPIAEREYTQTFGLNAWRRAIMQPFQDPASATAAGHNPPLAAEPPKAPEPASESTASRLASTNPLPKDPAVFAKNIVSSL